MSAFQLSQPTEPSFSIHSEYIPIFTQPTVCETLVDEIQRLNDIIQNMNNTIKQLELKNITLVRAMRSINYLSSNAN